MPRGVTFNVQSLEYMRWGRGKTRGGNLSYELPLRTSTIIIIKLKYSPASCEIEDFDEYTPPAVRSNILSKLIFASCVILRSRVLRVVCPHEGYRSSTPLGTTV